MVRLTWLHISDWHQKASTRLDRRVVRDAMINDIRNRAEIHPDLAVIDFIIFSGDLAYSGKSEEYQEARQQLLDPLLEACDLSHQQLFIVPGNHDLDRDLFDRQPNGFHDLLNTYDDVKDCLEAPECKNKILKPFEAFTNFVQAYSEQDHPDYACIKNLPIRGKEIALLGINSAWACGHHKDKSDEVDDRFFVFIGDHQVYDPLDSISHAAIKIAILHHPFEWLNRIDSDSVMNLLKDKCDFILQGHQHRSNVEVVHSPNGSCTIMPAGACYNRRATEDIRYASSYNFVHFDFDSKNFIVFFRRWSEPRKKWVEDVDSCDHGKWEYHSTLAVDRQHAIGATQPAEMKIMISVSSDEHLQGRKYSRIQEAVDAAEGRDTITVDEGIYAEIISIDKSLTIIGAGAGKTIIDSNQEGSVFIIGKHNSDIDVNLSGMTIKGGIGTSVLVNDNDPNECICGGGILNCGRLAITDSNITGNTAYYGGGIFNKGSLHLNSGTFVNQNIAHDGGGIFSNRGCRNRVIVNLNQGSSIENNQATGNGGGIYSGGSYVGENTVKIFPGSNISNNIAKNSGGGIWISNEGILDMDGGNISNNKGWTGGGIYNYGSNANLKGGHICNNAAMNGAGIENGGGQVILDGAQISGNIANRNDRGLGGGILSSGELILWRGSIDNNIAFTDGGGIFNNGQGTVIGHEELVHDNFVISRILDNIS